MFNFISLSGIVNSHINSNSDLKSMKTTPLNIVRPGFA